MINFNTDLAVERNDIYRKANNIENNIEGIETEEEEVNENVKISRVKIITDFPELIAAFVAKFNPRAVFPIAGRAAKIISSFL